MEDKKSKETKQTKKRRSYRKAHLEHFHRNVAGEYIYDGPTRGWGSPRGKNLRLLWLCALVALAAALAGGCIPGCGMERQPWTLVPYVVTLMLAFVQVWKLYRLTEGGDPVREYVWTATVKPLPIFSVLTAAFAGVAALTELVSLFLPGFSGRIYAGILYILLELLVFVASMAQRRLILRLEWT